MQVKKWIEEIPEQIIPAQKIPKCAYVAVDGREFYDEASCLEYEEAMKAKNRVDKLPRLMYVEIEGFDIDEVIHIKSYTEFNEVLQYLHSFKGLTLSTLQYWTFEGEDWYIFHSDYDDESWTTYYYMDTFKSLEKRYMKELNQFRKVED